MDPYIERPEIWPDFHDSLITFIRGALQPLLRPRFAALVQDRLYVVESERPIYPDVSVVRTSAPEAPTPPQAATTGVDAATVFAGWREEVLQPVIHIVEPAAGNRLVTAIEVLSPDNKTPGEGQNSYREKRRELLAGRSNLVEIDLLRSGRPTVRLSARRLARLPPWHYLVCVTRRRPRRQEVYSIPLPQRLPRVAIPLTNGVPDVPLDLQAVFTRCWEEGPYPELLRYEGPPPGGNLTPEEVAWCENLLRESGYRSQSPPQ
jgi:hypothetical protein